MRAIIHTAYGPPEVAKLMQVTKPIAKADEVLIKVYASTINRTDCGFRSAQYFISRFWSGLLRPKYQTLGCEFAGEIEEAGENCSKFKKGDSIFGYNDERFGGHAEYVVIKENDAITLIPQNISYTDAAPICEGAHYALSIINAAKVKPAQQVMVYGATGAIGSAAVQLLKYFGATVVAVCNTKNISMVKSLGADIVIDYQTQDVSKTSHRFDFIFDAVGKLSFGKCKKLLISNGIYISTELGKYGSNVFLSLVTPVFKGKKVMFPLPSMNKDTIELLSKLVAQGVYRPVIDRMYKLEDIVEAYKYVETGEKIGNVVLQVRE